MKKPGSPLVFIETPRILIVGLEAKHARTIASFYNSSDARTLLAATDFATEKEELEFIENSVTARDKVFGLVHKETGTLFGTIGLHKIDLLDRTATTGANIGLPEYRDKGYGTEAKMYFLEYAFHTLGLRVVYSEVIASNGRSIAYSKKCGYEVIAVYKKRKYRAGKYQDLVILSVWRKDWEKAWKVWRKKYLK